MKATSNSAYGSHEAPLSDQLTAYQLAEPEAEQLALCVLVKTRKPKIEWLRDSQTLGEYLEKAKLVAQEIQSGHFYRRPGKWCSWCDYLPVCSGDRTKVREALVQLQPHP